MSIKDMHENFEEYVLARKKSGDGVRMLVEMSVDAKGERYMTFVGADGNRLKDHRARMALGTTAVPGYAGQCVEGWFNRLAAHV